MVTSCLLRLVLYFAIVLSSSTVSQAISLMVSFFAPITRLLQRLTGRSSFTALLCPTAAAMAGVTSPSIESADMMPTGPMITSASRLATMTGFSPVAPYIAPPFSMVQVAMLFVPMAYTSQSTSLFTMASAMLCPSLPPCPSIITTFIVFSVLSGHLTSSQCSPLFE